MKTIIIHTSTILLEQALKFSGASESGGTAKALIQEGRVLVNNTIEKRRGKTLCPGDVITVFGTEYKITLEPHHS